MRVGIVAGIAASELLLVACGGGSSGGSHASGVGAAAAPMQLSGIVPEFGSAASADDDSWGPGGFRTVPKATCSAGDSPETGLQGQVPAALRAAGFKGFNCNLKLVSQVRGDGANWQTAEFRDRAYKCAYHGTSYSTVNRTQLGVPVIDVTDSARPVVTGYLTTTSMLDPWESLKVNERRQLLGADQGNNGGLDGWGGPGIDIYDVSQDCRYPQLLASKAVGLMSNGSSNGIPVAVVGHEGSWAPDGLTYYGGDLTNKQYYAVDTTIPTEPKLIASWKTGVVVPTGGTSLLTHGMSISDDGRRGYFVSLATLPVTDLTNPAVPAVNGLLIYDTSQVQDRKPNPQVPLISKLGK